jgi:hypothetical protein
MLSGFSGPQSQKSFFSGKELTIIVFCIINLFKSFGYIFFKSLYLLGIEFEKFIQKSLKFITIYFKNIKHLLIYMINKYTNK